MYAFKRNEIVRSRLERLCCVVLRYIMLHVGVVPYFLFAQSDSIRQIDEVTVRSRIRYHETIEPQQIDAARLSKLSAHTVADAIRWMSCVQLKDYGGIGGLKTVNLRSMGSQHVGINYDGIALGNAQNGVIDLGQFSLDNVESVSLYHGQRSAIMQTASDFACAGTIYIRTLNPAANLQDEPSTRLKLQYGSSQTLRASALHRRTLSHRVAMNLNLELLTSSGHYPFTYRRRNLDGSLAYDTTAIRQNGDVQAFRAESNLFGKLSEGHWQAKLYTNHSNRGIPGAIVNNVWRRGERQTDNNQMAQASWQKDVGSRNTLRAQMKYAFYRTHYINKDTTRLLVDNTYRQHEWYLNLTDVHEIRPWWSASVSYDARYNYLKSDRPQMDNPQRWLYLVALASAFDLRQLQIQASVVSVSTFDKQTTAGAYRRANHLAPALFASYRPYQWLQLRGFAKQSYRQPTFNDLYYTEIGNALLRPEKAQQYSIGVQIEGSRSAIRGRLEIDAYHNRINDKIVAYPKGQQFRWTMLNLGLVDIDGLEVRGETNWRLTADCKLTALMQYTYQQAQDVTSASDSYYRHQIPYTPWHSGSLTLMAELRREWSLGYNFVYTGERYCQQENIAYNHLQPWYTSDLTLTGRRGRYRWTIEVRNLLDQQYDVIINYPMPGRNYNLSIQCEL